MRSLFSARPLIGAVAVLVLSALPAMADEDVPSEAEVDGAQAAVTGQERTVAAVQADLVRANQRAEKASIRAAQAAEAFNAARWQLAEARAEVKAADARAARAEAALGKHELAYGEVLAATYEMSPAITSLAAMADADGIDGVLEKATTMYQLNSSMDSVQREYEAALEIADMATVDAEQAREEATELAERTAHTRQAAERQEQAALAEADLVAAQKDQLIAELAQLQNISVDLAARRQAALEQSAQEQAAQAAAAAVQAAAPAQAPATQPPSQQPNPPQPDNPPPAQTDPPAPNDPEPQPTDDPPPAQPDPPAPVDPTPPPPATGGAQAASSFARQQLGEPYQWGAAGPSSWDCSGLTMRAWQAGGKSLPHYSAGQYGRTTPIAAASLQPGDLVFWGSSNRPSSIYHVAMYTGNGMIIHAPRTGRPVVEQSMYYWIAPNFFGRP